MTMISVAVRPKHVEIVTDSAWYSNALQKVGYCTKVATFPHLSVAVVSQGSSLFGSTARNVLDQLTHEFDSFDELLPLAPELFRSCWEQIVADDSREKEPLVVLAGYSESDSRFIARGFTSRSNFEPWVIDEMFLYPTPIDLLPSEVELAQLRERGIHENDLAVLADNPPPTAPKDKRRWTDLVRRTRSNRVVTAPLPIRVFVGGKVFYTRMSRNAVQTELLLELDDTGEEFDKAVQGTLHPRSQLGPCECGSGRIYLECCLVKYFDEACICGSGRTFAECCMVDAAKSATSLPDAAYAR